MKEEQLFSFSKKEQALYSEDIIKDVVTDEQISEAEEEYATLAAKATFDLDKALDSYDPSFPRYSISEGALEFFAWMRLVQGKDFEFSTPIAHYFMVDLLLGNITDPIVFPYSEEVCKTITIDILRLGFMESRGLAKALPLDYPVMSEYMNKTIGSIKVGDRIYDGNGKICSVTAKSEVFNDKPMYRITLLDGRTIDMSEDHTNIVWKRKSKFIGTDKNDPIVCADGGKRFRPIKVNGLEEKSITAKELFDAGVTWNRKVNEKNPKGLEYKYWIPNVGTHAEYPETHFGIDPYTVGVVLGDGSIEKASGFTRVTCHNDDYEEYTKLIPYKFGAYTEKKDSNCGMFSLLGLGKSIKKLVGVDRSYTKKVPIPLLHGSRQQRLEVLRGLMDTDGSVYKDGYCAFYSTSVKLAENVQELVRSLGGSAGITKNKTPSQFGVSYRVRISINEVIFKLKRKVSRQTFRNDKYCVAVTKIEKVESRPTQCITVDSPHQSFITKDWTVTHNSTVVLSFFGVYSAMKGKLPNGIGEVFFYVVLAASSRGGARVNALAVKAMCEDSEFLKEYFEDMRFTETESEFIRRGSGPKKDRSFLIRYQGIATGIRGSRYGERRPDAIFMDDAILNTAAAYSKIMSDNLEEIVYSDATNALKGGGRGRVVLTFTPFHYGDVNTKALLNGAFTPVVIPLAKSFDAERDVVEGDIESSWAAMHPSSSIAKLCNDAKKAKKLGSFLQERMLRLTSGSDRLVPEKCIQFCDMVPVVKNIDKYNVYITTDYTTTSGEGSDFSGRATWAVSNNEDWFMLSLSLRKLGMSAQYEDTLDEATKWRRRGKHVEIGVEVDGNQSAHIYSLESLMMQRGEFFTFAKQKGAVDLERKGILSKSTGVKKHERFRIAVNNVLLPKKMWLPEHLRDTPEMDEFLAQVRGATHEQFTRADDGPDLITMGVVSMHVLYPSEGYSSTVVTSTDKYYPEPYDDDEDISGSTVF